jgi:hypothetical protein
MTRFTTHSDVAPSQAEDQRFLQHPAQQPNRQFRSL